MPPKKSAAPQAGGGKKGSADAKKAGGGKASDSGAKKPQQQQQQQQSKKPAQAPPSKASAHQQAPDGDAGDEVAKSRKDLKRDRKIAQQLAGPSLIGTCESTVTVQGRNFDADDIKESESSGEVECIKIEHFSIAFRGEDLLNNATLKLVVGHRYGLVGPNGSGKSTVLRHIAERKLPGIPSNLQILHVEQEVVGDDTPAVESVLNADTLRLDLLAERTKLEAELETAADDAAAGNTINEAALADESRKRERLQEVYELLRAIGADSAYARACAILSGLQFTPTMQGMPTKEFSGGWRMRIALARALFCRPAVLLLDEPTNHLDLHALVWLENYLSRWKKTLLIVSHDKNFLNTVCTDIIHLYNKKLEPYRGTFDAFQKTAKLRIKEQINQYEKRKALEDEIHKLKSGDQSKAQKDRKKAQKSRHTPEQIAALVSQKERALAKLPEVQAPPKAYNVRFEFPDPDSTLPHPVIQVQDVDFAYPVNGVSPDPDAVPVVKQDKSGKKERLLAKDGARPGEFIFRGLNFGLDMESRVALVGRNGAGKTTLLHLLAKNLTPTRGHVEHASRLRIGWFAQHFADQLQTDMSPVMYLHEKYPEHEYETLRKYLGMFGLPGKRHLQAIQTLSGGEKNRVVFASIALYGAHLLFLDEPTNHLDMESIAALVKGVKKFTGGVVLVSHDQRLISAACEEIWVVDDQTVETFEGDIYDYRQMLIDEMDLGILEEE